MGGGFCASGASWGDGNCVGGGGVWGLCTMDVSRLVIQVEDNDKDKGILV